MDQEEMSKLKAEILNELTDVFNERVALFFNRDFNPALESIVDAKWSELNQSEHNLSMLDQTFLKGDNESKLEEYVNRKLEGLKTEMGEKNE